MRKKIWILLQRKSTDDFVPIKDVVLNGNFQMIVLEHIPVEYVSDLENIHVVEEFFNGNALIPHSEYESINRG